MPAVESPPVVLFEEIEHDQVLFRRFVNHLENAIMADGSSLSLFVQTKRFEDLMNQGNTVFGTSLDKLEKKKWNEDQLKKFEKVEKQFTDLERLLYLENLFNIQMNVNLRSNKMFPASTSSKSFLDWDKFGLYIQVENSQQLRKVF